MNNGYFLTLSDYLLSSRLPTRDNNSDTPAESTENLSCSIPDISAICTEFIPGICLLSPSTAF